MLAAQNTSETGVTQIRPGEVFSVNPEPKIWPFPSGWQQDELHSLVTLDPIAELGFEVVLASGMVRKCASHLFQGLVCSVPCNDLVCLLQISNCEEVPEKLKLTVSAAGIVPRHSDCTESA